jgi:hypothetical protein
MEISDKINVKRLVGKKIFLFCYNKWNEGTIYTSNNYDYEFLSPIFSNCIGAIPVTNTELKKRGGKDCFELSERTGIIFYHGGKNPFCLNKKSSAEYKTLKDFLDSAIKNSK